MKDLGRSLLDKVEQIIDVWVREVRRDLDIESVRGLTYEAVHNDLPDVLTAIATLLTAAFADQEDELEENSLEHGAVRAEQGFDTAEVVREYRVLRNVILAELEPDLSTGSVAEALEAVRKIDSVLDDAVMMSLEEYVNQRIKAIEQVQGQLLLTNQELTRLVQSQQDNVSFLAHELKTPLNSIIGFSSLLLRKQRQQLAETAGSSLEMQQIERIVNNGRQLLRMINNALEISRQEKQPGTLTIESVRVTPLVQTVVDAFEPTAQEKSLELTLDCDRAPEQVETDAMRLQQILTNLVSNAIRYTDAGKVSVCCYTVDAKNEWAIAVEDTGKGIDSEAQLRVFEPYFRVGSEDEYLPESTGLGLAIVSNIVQLLRGRVDLNSKAGVGSTFTVFLPLEPS
ncbi:MAG: sensor histidine kinase [Cyanobacteria bacterium P01_A01_bin.114]